MTIGFLLSSNNCDTLGVIDSYSRPSKELERGYNVGNFAFKYGASLLFDEDFKFFRFDDNPELINQECSALILPMANLVNPNINHGKGADFLEKTTKPIWAMGVGAQASLNREKVELQEGTVRFLKVLAEKSHSTIFCRGEFTAECLSRMGIQNVEIAGCPSYLINPSQNLWQKLLVKSRKRSPKNIGITEGSYNLKGSAGAQRLEKLFIDMVFYCGCYYIAQTNLKVIQHALPIKPSNFEETQARMRKSMAPKLSLEEFCSIANSRFLAFWRMDAWLAALSRMDFVTGTRIHGNILALQSGTPAIPIAHDSRTLGLCQTLKIPYSTITQAQEWSSPSQVISQLDIWKEISSKELDSHRCQLAGKYLNQILSMNLKPSKHLSHLASGFSQDQGSMI